MPAQAVCEFAGSRDGRSRSCLIKPLVHNKFNVVITESNIENRNFINDAVETTTRSILAQLLRALCFCLYASKSCLSF